MRRCERDGVVKSRAVASYHASERSNAGEATEKSGTAYAVLADVLLFYNISSSQNAFSGQGKT